MTTLEGLAELDAAVAETGKRWWVMFGERFENRAVAEACRRAQLGDVGRVASVLGLGPHRMGADGRPDWFCNASAANRRGSSDPLARSTRIPPIALASCPTTGTSNTSPSCRGSEQCGRCGR